MFRFRGDTSQVSTEMVCPRSKEGRARSSPKVAVLCRAVNKKWVTFKGGVQETTSRCVAISSVSWRSTWCRTECIECAKNFERHYGFTVCSEGTPPRSVPRGVCPRSKEGRARSGPKVAVLCRAVNKKWVTFEGGVQERV